MVCIGLNERSEVVMSEDSTVLWKPISDTAIQVNLSVAPKLPFEGAQLAWNNGAGEVTVESRRGELCVNDRRVVLFYPDLNPFGTYLDFCRDPAFKMALHPNIMDALLENKHLIPADWKSAGVDRRRHLHFFAAGFQDLGGNVFVRSSTCGTNDQWVTTHKYRGSDWTYDSVYPILEIVPTS